MNKTATMPISKVKAPTPAMVRPSALPFDATVVQARKRFAETEKARKAVEHEFKEGMRVAAYLRKIGKTEMAKNVHMEAWAAVSAAGFYIQVTNGAFEVK